MQIVGGIKNREYINLWPCAILTTALMLLTGCLSADNARKSILWDVYLTIAAAFGVSRAMELTGVAREFSDVFVSLSECSVPHWGYYYWGLQALGVL